MYKRHFLTRRRYDTVALACVFALWPVSDNLAKILLGLFIFAGGFLVVRGHRTVRQAPWAFSAILFAYGAWSVCSSVVRGEPVLANRQVGYGLIAMAMAFFPMGIVLVAQPLRAAVQGARIGVVAATLLAGAAFAAWSGRVGVGENEAIFAFVIALVGVLARIEVRDPIRWLPNSRLWLYLSFVPVLLSQTRAVWGVYALALLLDLVFALRRGWHAGNRIPAAVALILAAVIVYPASLVIQPRVESALSEYAAYDRNVQTYTSIGIRMALWQGALETLADHPLMGVGATRRVAESAARVPASEATTSGFTHLHNLVLDEALSNGIIGLVLLAAVFAAFLAGVWRSTRLWSVRQASILLTALIVSFGFFHGVMVNETTLMAIYASFATILVDARRARRDALP